VNTDIAPLRHPALPLERIARARGAALPAAWMPQVEGLAASSGRGACERHGVRLHVYLPDPRHDRSFGAAMQATLGDEVVLGPLHVRRGSGPLPVRPVMAYHVEVPLRLGGPLRGEMHRRGVEPDAFDIKLHAARARGVAALAALLDLDAWLDERAGDEAMLAMRLHRWEPGDPGPRAA
jgi:hypothetical protein